MTFTSVAVVAITLCTAGWGQTHISDGRAGQWQSWHQEQRNAYVYGFIDGYLNGFLTACQSTDQLFEKEKPHHPRDAKHPTESDMPSARCLDNRAEFSMVNFDKAAHVDVSLYTDVITAFYQKHSNCGDFPFSLLLQTLGSKYITADELYELASNARIQGTEIRSREWCSVGTSKSSNR